MRNSYKNVVEKREGERPVGRSRLRWEDGVRMDLKETGWEVVDWIHLAQDMDHWRAVMYIIMNLRFPQNAGNFLSS
jgi:hypothetical protein